MCRLIQLALTLARMSFHKSLRRLSQRLLIPHGAGWIYSITSKITYEKVFKYAEMHKISFQTCLFVNPQSEHFCTGITAHRQFSLGGACLTKCHIYPLPLTKEIAWKKPTTGNSLKMYTVALLAIIHKYWLIQIKLQAPQLILWTIIMLMIN